LSSRSDVLCDAGPLISLGKLNRIEVLAELYGEVQIPHAVYDEVVTSGLAKGASDAMIVRLFLQRRKWPIVNVPRATLASYTPPVVLDAGERAVLALAQTVRDPLVLIDDEVARSEARRLGLPLRGTLGVLVQACREKVLTLAQTEILIQEVSIRRDIWISGKLCEQVLSELRRGYDKPEPI
jgi:predicted nucleic acid-binding protein